mmetsp:Transcript_95424/g.169406  ORF Transcript_95424/g.169406 Transcript_95424/m.169406 type:complete len:334 (-) Transcript_95424:73-1074(-)
MQDVTGLEDSLLLNLVEKAATGFRTHDTLQLELALNELLEQLRRPGAWPGERAQRAKEVDLLTGRELGMDSATTWLCPMLLREELAEVAEALIEELAAAKHEEVIPIFLGESLGSVQVSVASKVSDWTMADGRFLWHGARAMIQLISTDSLKLRGLHVLELGAGLGVVGMACAKAGAKTVLLTDYDDDLLSACNRSIHLNALDSVVSTARLDWDDLVAGSPTGLATEYVYDAVVGADIIYDARHSSSVLGSVARLIGEDYAREAWLVTGEPEKREGILHLDSVLGVDDAKLSVAELSGTWEQLSWQVRRLAETVDGRPQRLYHFAKDCLLPEG